ncbi:MAG: ComF family protein [Pirellulales bacterium]|nr:ComF family protein [Pirellulales bacterium]
MQRLDQIIRPAHALRMLLCRATPEVCGQLADLIYPPRCAWCRGDIHSASDTIALCHDCRAKLAPPLEHRCQRCSAAIAYLPEVGEDCIHCRASQFRFHRVVALGNYRLDLRRAILETKHRSGEILAQSLTQLLLERRRGSLGELNAEIVVPVAMHWRRRLRRGTNGPELMAAALARNLQLPFAAGALYRSKYTRRQSESTLRERRVNQRNSFRVRRAKQIAGRRVLLVDDVLTTGATCNAASKALLAAGAASVVVAVFARAVGDDVL